MLGFIPTRSVCSFTQHGEAHLRIGRHPFASPVDDNNINVAADREVVTLPFGKGHFLMTNLVPDVVHSTSLSFTRTRQRFRSTFFLFPSLIGAL